MLQDEKKDKVHFLLIGDGQEKERLVAKAQSWGLNNMSFYKAIAKSAVPKLLRDSSIIAIPSRKSDLYRYGISANKLFDSMICIKPIVWAIDSANDPVAEANCGITVPPEDAEAMAEAILKVCALSDKERQEMGVRGYEYVMKYHSVPVLAKRLLEVMEEAKQH